MTVKRISTGTYQIRLQALELATQAMNLYDFESGQGFMSTLYSLTVFYEKYLLEGSEGTRKEFGPKPPIKLKKVPKV